MHALFNYTTYFKMVVLIAPRDIAQMGELRSPVCRIPGSTYKWKHVAILLSGTHTALDLPRQGKDEELKVSFRYYHQRRTVTGCDPNPTIPGGAITMEDLGQSCSGCSLLPAYRLGDRRLLDGPSSWQKAGFRLIAGRNIMTGNLEDT
ncbi:hypothetical protein EJ110_NYTH32692 [Nymphaea thermarum]|nr:hypothetical protein EJ110_NYTH32692 [Nymphaea thermarum]